MERGGRAQRVIERMKLEGKVFTLSNEASVRIDNKIAEQFLPIKQDSAKKERASRAYIVDVESGRINFYKN